MYRYVRVAKAEAANAKDATQGDLTYLFWLFGVDSKGILKISFSSLP